MIEDEDPKLRKLDYFRITKARNHVNSGVWMIFKVPEIMRDANVYYDLIEWKTHHLDANPGMNSKFITYYTHRASFLIKSF